MARKKTPPLIEDFDSIPPEALVPENEQPYPIPEHWHWVFLGSVASVSKDKTNVFYDEQPYLGLENLHAGGGIASCSTAAGVKSAKSVFVPGNILYGRLRPYLDKHAVVNFEGVCSTDILVYAPSPALNASFFDYWLSTSVFRDAAINQSKGINLPRVSEVAISSFPFPLPPLEEQEQIIEHLQTCTQKIDLVLGKLEDFLTESTSRTEALLSAAVGGYLTEDWREERKIPRDSWKLTTLGDAFKWSSGGTPSRKNPHYYVGTIPWIKSGELNDSLVTETEEHISELAIKESSAKVFPAGSVAIAMYGATIGKVGTLGMNAATNQAVAVAQTAEHTHTRSLLFFLRANRNRFISLGKGGAQPNISQQIIKAFSYQIPSLPEQAEIIRLVDLYLDRLSQAETLIVETVASLNRGKNGLVTAAMAGRFTSKPE